MRNRGAELLVNHHTSIEASEMGWAPGVWPAHFTFEGHYFSFWRRDENICGDLISKTYRDSMGYELVVFND